jgi:hypothetical protein
MPHILGANGRTATDQPSSFAAIAKRPGFDAARIAPFLLDRHPKMSGMSSTRLEAADLEG